MGKSLCLNMIVKNESANLLRCLASLAPHISCYEITDTGSTDDTIELIEEFFDERGIPGRVSDAPFYNFEQARNAALNFARTSVYTFDYILFCDADMELVVDDPKWREKLDAPQYTVLQKGCSLAYWNVRLVGRYEKGEYHGVTHEYFDRVEGEQQLQGAWFRDHATGSNRENKAERDIKLLIEDLAKHPNRDRSWFYLAQSYKDSGDIARAIPAYKQRIELGGWDEEVFFAKLQLARCYEGDEFVTAAVTAYDFRPTRAEPLYELAKYHRLKGQNAASVLFSDAALALPKSKDILFVDEHAQMFGPLEERSIASFYVPSRRQDGFRATETLLLHPQTPAPTRALAKNNMHFYYGQLATLERKPVGPFTPPAKWNALNPSITIHQGKMKMVVRTVNYIITESGQYDMQGDTAIRTRNFLCDVADDLSVTRQSEILPPTDFPEPLCTDVLGFEDMRLISYDDHLWCSSTVLELNKDWWREQVLARIDEEILSQYRLDAWRPMRLPTPVHQKNWMPFVDDGKLSFRYDYRTVYQPWPNDGYKIESFDVNIYGNDFRGGSQLVPFNGGWLAVIHEAGALPDSGKRYYWHRFVLFGADHKLDRVSAPFYFNDKNIEFAAGMCVHPDGNRLVISYGVQDREAWLCTVAVETVMEMLGLPVEMPPMKAIFAPARIDPHRWTHTHLNSALCDKSEVDEAVQLLTQEGLVLHTDRNKNWDTALAVFECLDRTRPGDSILDAGTDDPSAFLLSLARRGYEHLEGVNTNLGRATEKDGVVYGFGDITNLSYNNEQFAFVLCQSVIEHGFEGDVMWKFLNEMARVIKPHGHLFISTDYWKDGVDTKGQQAFDAPIRVFDEVQIKKLVSSASHVGFDLTASFLPGCGERVVNWMGMDYTFCNLLFERRD